LLPYVAAFERLLRSQGYAPPTIRLKVRLVRDFGLWLRKRAIGLKDLSVEHAERYLRHRARHLRPRTDDLVGLSQLLDLLRKKGLVAQRRVCKQSMPLDRLVDQYALYLREERAVAPVTVALYSRVARGFWHKALVKAVSIYLRSALSMYSRSFNVKLRVGLARRQRMRVQLCVHSWIICATVAT